MHIRREADAPPKTGGQFWEALLGPLVAGPPGHLISGAFAGSGLRLAASAIWIVGAGCPRVAREQGR